MNSHPSPALFAALSLMMLMTGLGIPVMAALNAGLGRHLGSPSATAVLFLVGFGLAALVTVCTGLPTWDEIRNTPRPLFFGAIFMTSYVLAITFAAPRIGLGNAVFFVLLGQLVAASVIDHFGLFGAIQTSFTPRRGFGLAVMAVGLFFARRPA